MSNKLEIEKRFNGNVANINSFLAKKKLDPISRREGLKFGLYRQLDSEQLTRLSYVILSYQASNISNVMELSQLTQYFKIINDSCYEPS
jgi:hypothetical protein